MINIPGSDRDDERLRPKALGIPWYTAKTYDKCLAIYEDRDNMHDSFFDWLAAAMVVEKEATKKGLKAVRVMMDPDEFIAWCRANKMRLNGQARTVYAAAMAMRSLKPE